MILYWLDAYHDQIVDILDASDPIAVTGTEDMAWNRLVVGRRVARLAFMLDCYRTFGIVDKDQDARLSQAILAHLHLLSQDGFINTTHNHGLFQALGVLATTHRFPDWLEIQGYQAWATKCLGLTLSAVVSSDGCLKEHSPGYHYQLTSILKQAVDHKLLTNEGDVAKVGGMVEALSWMVAPDGALATLGDTEFVPRAFSVVQASNLAGKELASTFTNGQAFGVPRTGEKLFSEGGFFFSRRKVITPGTFDRETSYLAQQLATHSRAHKHADDLTFLWYDRGLSILTDPGFFGYSAFLPVGDPLRKLGFTYADPRRMYVEKTSSHNCVQIEGLDTPRTPDFFTGTYEVHTGATDNYYWTTAKTCLSPTTNVIRTVLAFPSEFLLVLDWVQDRQKNRRTFDQWFNFDPDWHISKSLDRRGKSGLQTHVLSRSSSTLEDLSKSNQLFLTSLFGHTKTMSYHGSVDPMHGWTSQKINKLIPSVSTRFQHSRTSNGRFMTLLSWDCPIKKAVVKVSPSLAKGFVAWNTARASYEIWIDRNKNDFIVGIKGA